MTKLFLAAGVAALAIAAPVSADRGDRGDRGGGNKGGQAAKVERGGGGQGAQRAQRAQRVERQAGPRMERQQRVARAERRQERVRPGRAERVQVRDRQEARVNRAERQQVRANRAERQQVRANRAERQQLRANRVERQQLRANRDERQQLRADRGERVRNRAIDRQLRGNRDVNRDMLREGRIDRIRVANGGNQGRGWGVGGCPPGLLAKGCVPPGQQTSADAAAFRQSRLAVLATGNRLLNPVRVHSFIGEPLRSVSTFTTLAALPSTVQYLYPDTDDYYYRYGGGYAYRVDRDNDLISLALPLLAGGLLPGQYLPATYMNNYVPNYYGFNNFYPSSYANSAYDCNRYVNGVIYEVDCGTGYIEDVIPLYASGYGVGQMLPASYGYYNVPTQYRDLYYNTPQHNYWYAPGAIYQVDPTSQLITAVASLLAPGLTIGQQLPMGYNTYNVPLAYRDTYYDTSSAWYRYNNGHIYQVDPTTQLVTAIVASILT